MFTIPNTISNMASTMSPIAVRAPTEYSGQVVRPKALKIMRIDIKIKSTQPKTATILTKSLSGCSFLVYVLVRLLVFLFFLGTFNTLLFYVKQSLQ